MIPDRLLLGRTSSDDTIVENPCKTANTSSESMQTVRKGCINIVTGTTPHLPHSSKRRHLVHFELLRTPTRRRATRTCQWNCQLSHFHQAVVRSVWAELCDAGHPSEGSSRPCHLEATVPRFQRSLNSSKRREGQLESAPSLLEQVVQD